MRILFSCRKDGLSRCNDTGEYVKTYVSLSWALDYIQGGNSSLGKAAGIEGASVLSRPYGSAGDGRRSVINHARWRLVELGGAAAFHRNPMHCRGLKDGLLFRLFCVFLLRAAAA